MKQPINYIYETIVNLNPVHSKKLKKNIESFHEQYYIVANIFFEKYISILELENKTLDYSIDCYLKMIADVNTETVEFMRTGRYTSSNFEEVNQRVYARPEIMESYMHGLIMSQFLWKHHYDMFDFYINTLPKYISTTKSYLEVGAGHGFYLSETLKLLNVNTSITVVDISETSIEMARNFSNDGRVDFILRNIFDFSYESKYDFITLGEVLEHVEKPLDLLLKLYDLLSEDGTIFITTPTNAPAIDHIFLFNDIDEIRELVKLSGFAIDFEHVFPSEDLSIERTAKLKISVLFGAFLKKAKTFRLN